MAKINLIDFFDSRRTAILILFLVALLHLPFLTADPDTKTDVNTRGAWTDEGLYASQSRNMVNTGGFSVDENSTMIRGPLQTIVYMPAIFVFGEKLVIVRFISLLIIVLAMALLTGVIGQHLLVVAASLIMLTQFHIFHFSHYAMAEIICSGLVIMSMVYLVKYMRKPRFISAFYSSLFIFLAYAFKIQYLYFAGIAPLAVIILNAAKLFDSNTRRQSLKAIFLFSGLAAAFFALYMLIWYLPNKEFYKYVMSRETGQRFVFKAGEVFHIIRITYTNHIGLAESKLLRYLFVISLIITPFIYRKLKETEKIVLVFLLSWLALESHKLFMPHYLPVRYMLSGMIAAGLVVSLVCIKLLSMKRWWVVAVIIAGVSLTQNAFHYYHSLERRTYEIRAINDYLNSYDLKGQTVLGPWSSTACWGTRAKTYPVWNNFLNHDKINEFSPRIIVSELNEADSGEAYSSHGIDLYEVSDSVKVFKLWRYEVGVFWLNR